MSTVSNSVKPVSNRVEPVSNRVKTMSNLSQEVAERWQKQGFFFEFVFLPPFCHLLAYILVGNVSIFALFSYPGHHFQHESLFFSEPCFCHLSATSWLPGPALNRELESQIRFINHRLYKTVTYFYYLQPF